MKVLAFSDLHRDLGAAASLVERSAEADVDEETMELAHRLADSRA